MRGIRPVGLGARDTLRLEAGMPLYGHELSDEIDPIQAGLGWAVKADHKDFIGKDALAKRPNDRNIRVGLRIDDRRIARQGFTILRGYEEIGIVTSGTKAPTLDASLAMGYVRPDCATEGCELQIGIRNCPRSRDRGSATLLSAKEEVSNNNG